MGIRPPRSYPVEGFRLAACREADPDLFFAPDRESPVARLERERRAKAVCARCAVREPCLQWALATNERNGVWGGLGEEERLELKRSRVRTIPGAGHPQRRRRPSRVAAIA